MEQQSNDLRLPLIRKWYDMTDAGIKSEDYREITPYWINRLVGGVFDEKGYRNPPIGHYDECDYHRFVFRQFDHNIMTLGYPKKGDPERTATFKHAGIEIRKGNCDWGAEPNKLYFVIRHGERVELPNFPCLSVILGEKRCKEQCEQCKYKGLTNTEEV